MRLWNLPQDKDLVLEKKRMKEVLNLQNSLDDSWTTFVAEKFYAHKH